MRPYSELNREELEVLKNDLKKQYDAFCNKNLSLDMSRGKPCPEQLDLSENILQMLQHTSDCFAKNGLDCRNYGLWDGIGEAKLMFGELLGISPEQLVLGGNSSLNMMYDTISRAYNFGFFNSPRPWCKEEKIKFLCPSPGYDRHFAISEIFGMEMIPIPMTPTGPDMDAVEYYVENDKHVKGIWCVPKYSNPQGITYSDETVRRFANLTPKAPDFRIFWDNAYAIHDLYEEKDHLLNIFDACSEASNPDIVILFSSTSKITFPGSGVAIMAASPRNLEFMKQQISIQTIGPDKLNQLRHVRSFKNAAGVLAHMKKHAAILRPKFEAAQEVLSRELEGTGVGTWTLPKGGYFIGFDTMEGCAKYVYQLCKNAGVVLTTAGATFPHGIDPKDKNIRLAPSYPSVDELKQAMEVFCVCVKLAAVEKLLED